MKLFAWIYNLWIVWMVASVLESIRTLSTWCSASSSDRTSAQCTLYNNLQCIIYNVYYTMHMIIYTFLRLPWTTLSSDSSLHNFQLLSCRVTDFPSNFSYRWTAGGPETVSLERFFSTICQVESARSDLPYLGQNNCCSTARKPVWRLADDY